MSEWLIVRTLSNETHGTKKKKLRVRGRPILRFEAYNL